MSVRASLPGETISVTEPSIVLATRPQLAPRILQVDSRSISLPRTRLIILVSILLFISATRIPRFDQRELHPDEIWSVWQTLGTPVQIVRWTPHDWTPVYYLFLGLWRALIGIQPFALLMHPFLQFLIAEAVLYRVARRLFNESAACIAVLSFAALGFNFHLSMLLRAYMTILMLMVIALWLAVRYFEHPTRQRGFWLALSLTVMLYLHLTAIFGVGMIVLFTLLVYPRRARYWVQPGVLTLGLSIPLLVWPKTASAVETAVTTLSVYTNPAFLDAIYHKLLETWQDFAGYYLSMWAALLVFAGVLIIQARRRYRHALGLFLWMLTPAVLVLIAPVFGAFNTRHMAWVSIGIALWLGWGFSNLAGRANLGVAVVLILGMIGPVPINAPGRIPTTTVLRQLAEMARWGDVALVDPRGLDVNGEEWDYYSQVYFPQGLTFVSNPNGYRRVWYISDPAHKNPLLEGSVQRERVLMATIGDSGITAELYESPPDIQGIAFENGMRFHGADVEDARGPEPALHAGEPIRLRLWWSVDRQQDLDYSVGTYVIDGSGLFAQFDGPPKVKDAPSETSRWLIGHTYVEEREIVMPYPVNQNSLTIYLAVYYWKDQKRLTAPGVNADGLLPLQPIQIRHWTTPDSHP
jgi:hypothetical protein